MAQMLPMQACPFIFTLCNHLSPAPGPVDQFAIHTGDNGTDYRTLKVTWKIPTILKRNSEITGYSIKYNDTSEVKYS